MGRGVSTPSRAKAIAVASGPPMKIGRSALLARSLAQQDDRRVGRKLDPYADELHLDHGEHPTPAPGGHALAMGSPATPSGRSEVLAQSEAQHGGAQVVAQLGELVQRVERLLPRRTGLRCLSSGRITCSNSPASRSAAVLYMRKWRASMPKRRKPAAMRATTSASSS